MALNFYRRHRRDCTAGHPEESRSGELEERRKGWRRCTCPIFCSGTLNKKYRRESTGQWEWGPAKDVAARWEKAGSWDGPAPVVPTPEPAIDAPPRMRITDAVKVYLVNRESAGIEPATLRKYRTFTKHLTAFAEERGYVMVDQFTTPDIDLFYAGWKLGPRAKGKALGTLRNFFRFCAKRKWITLDPTDPESVGPVSSDLKPPKGANQVANKVPFTDEELERIIRACDAIGTIAWQSGTEHGTWSGEDAKDFIWTAIYTGLRISDVALFHMKRLKGNDVFLRAKKNGGDVFTYIPDWLRDRLLDRAKLHGVRPFVGKGSDRLETVTDLWRRKVNKVFELAGHFEEPPTVHRFRHTFARILLQRGVPVADVADLLGDDEETVRTHYARWVPERQARLTNILKDAFADKPKPKLVKMPAHVNS